MSKIKHIVFPVDFSDRSNSAVPFVAEMARRHEAKVTLLAVAPSLLRGWGGRSARDGSATDS